MVALWRIILVNGRPDHNNVPPEVDTPQEAYKPLARTNGAEVGRYADFVCSLTISGGDEQVSEGGTLFQEMTAGMKVKDYQLLRETEYEM